MSKKFDAKNETPGNVIPEETDVKKNALVGINDVFKKQLDPSGDNISLKDYID